MARLFQYLKGIEDKPLEWTSWNKGNSAVTRIVSKDNGYNIDQKFQAFQFCDCYCCG